MANELFRLFNEGGGKDLQTFAAVRAGALASEFAPWLAISRQLAAVQDDALDLQLARALASTKDYDDYQEFRSIEASVTEFLQSNVGDRQAAVHLLVGEAERIEERFGITPWQAYWNILT